MTTKTVITIKTSVTTPDGNEISTQDTLEVDPAGPKVTWDQLKVIHNQEDALESCLMIAVDENEDFGLDT